jgi:hypothetical protein
LGCPFILQIHYIALRMYLFLWIVAILVSVAAGYWVYRADVRRAIPYPWLTAALRSLVILCTFFLLIAPTIRVDQHENKKPLVFFLQDNSESIPEALKRDTALYRKNATDLIDKLSSKYKVIKWGFDTKVRPDTLFRYTGEGTDIAAALEKAVEFYGQQNLGAIILATDGRFNQGLNPVFQDLPFQGSLYTAALGDSLAAKDIRVTRVYANKTVSLSSQFEIRADIVASRCSGYNNSVQLKEVNGAASGSAGISIATDQFDKSVSFTLKADRPGMHHYIIQAPAAEGETNTANNRRDVFVEVVSEKKNILIAAAAPHPDINAIREALSGLDEYSITVKTGDNLPSSFADYQVVILHSLPSQSNLVRQLAASHKAVWFIMGSQSANAAFNQAQQLAKLNVNPTNLQNINATWNSSFTSFTMPQNINAVMDKMPPLAIPGGTIEASPEALVLFSARGNGNMPLWMIRQGSQPTALLVGEGLWRWRMFEYRNFGTHNVIDEAIKQTVSFLSANSNDRPFRVELPKYAWSDQEAITLNAYLLNANNEQVNGPDAKLVITDSAGNKQDFSFERSGNAYKLNLGLRAAGTYTYIARATYEGKALVATGSFVVQNMPLEMMETGADYPLLHSLSRKYHGSLVPGMNISALYDSIANNPNIKPVISTTSDTVPLIDWKWYFAILLLLAATEWLLRKYWLAQ